MKKFYKFLFCLVFGLGLTYGVKSQTTVFYQENFSGKTADELVTEWKISNINGNGGGQLNGKVDLSENELHIISGGWYCTPVISPVNVSDYDEFIVSFRYKTPKSTYSGPDKLSVYLGEEYQYWGNIGNQQLLLESGVDNSYTYASFTIGSWSSSKMELCFFISTNGGEGVYIDDIEIKGIVASNPPVVDIAASSQMIFKNDEVQLFDCSSEAPTSFSWEITPGNAGDYYQYVNGTDSTSKNPEIQFLVEGIYDIRLTATNAYGSSSKTFPEFITVSCPAISENINTGYISNVYIGSKEYTSSNSSYTSFADDPVNLPLGSDFTIEIRTSDINSDWWWNSPSNGTSRNVVAWFDWDKNGFFDETPEIISIAREKIQGTWLYRGTVTVSIPSSVTPGKVNMRIKLANQADDVASACGNVSYGEVEDYAIDFYSGSVSSLLGNAFSFNGGYAETESPALSNGSAFTVEGWFKVVQVKDNQGFVGQQRNFALGIKNSSLVFETNGGISVSTPWIYTNRWIHVAVSGNGTALTMYVNGTPVSSAPGGTYWNGTSTSSLRFAKGIFTDDFVTDPALIGEMDEVRFWSTALDSASIASGMFNTVLQETANLESYYQFNDVQISESLKDWEGDKHAVLYDSFSDDYVQSGVPFLWTGNSDGVSYNLTSNWSWGSEEMPFSANKGILISGSDISLSAGNNYRIGSLELRPGAKFTIEENASLTVTDSLILESTYDQLSSFMDAGEVGVQDGRTRVELDVPKDNYWYLSTPLQNARAQWFGNLSSDTNADDWVFVHRNVNGNQQWQRVTSDMGLNALEGVSVWYYTQNKQLDYSGSLNKGDISYTYTDADYYLVGNPYATAIDWDNDAGWARDGFSNTIWFRVSYNGFRVWQTYNKLISAIAPEDLGYSSANESYIAPYQTVWVEATQSNATLTVKEAAKVVQSGSLPLKSASSDNNSGLAILRVKVANTDAADGCVIYFDNRFDVGKDKYDAEKRFNSAKEIPEVYLNGTGRSLSIDGQPALTENKYDFPIGVRNQIKGNVTLSFDLGNFNITYGVYLEDKETGSWTNLRENNEYVYTPSQMGDDKSRFVLHLERVSRVATGIENPEESSVTGISIIGEKEYALVQISRDLLQSSGATVEVLDMSGRLMSNRTTGTTETEVALPDNSGVYVLRVKAGGREKVGKVVVP